MTLLVETPTASHHKWLRDDVSGGDIDHTGMHQSASQDFSCHGMTHADMQVASQKSIW